MKLKKLFDLQFRLDAEQQCILGYACDMHFSYWLECLASGAKNYVPAACVAINAPKHAHLQFHRSSHRPSHLHGHSSPPHRYHRLPLRFPPHLLLHRPLQPCLSPQQSTDAYSNAHFDFANFVAIAIAALGCDTRLQSFDVLLRRSNRALSQQAICRTRDLQSSTIDTGVCIVEVPWSD